MAADLLTFPVTRAAEVPLIFKEIFKEKKATITRISYPKSVGKTEKTVLRTSEIFLSFVMWIETGDGYLTTDVQPKTAGNVFYLSPQPNQPKPV